MHEHERRKADGKKQCYDNAHKRPHPAGRPVRGKARFVMSGNTHKRVVQRTFAAVQLEECADIDYVADSRKLSLARTRPDNCI